MPVHVPHRHHLDRHADVLAAQGTGAPDDLLTERATGDWLQKSQQWLQIGRHAGYGPPYLRIGRNIRYRRSDVLAWLDQRLHHSTSEYVNAEKPPGRRLGSKVEVVDGRRVVIPPDPPDPPDPPEAKPAAPTVWGRAVLRRRGASEPKQAAEVQSDSA